jgi:hypothetical protein
MVAHVNSATNNVPPQADVEQKLGPHAEGIGLRTRRRDCQYLSDADAIRIRNGVDGQNPRHAEAVTCGDLLEDVATLDRVGAITDRLLARARPPSAAAARLAAWARSPQ